MRSTQRLAEPPAAAKAPRWGFGTRLLILLVIGGVLRGALLWDYVAHDAFASYLTLDAATYWNWAGRLAAGGSVSAAAAHEPYFSAPLYPYLLALLRMAGGGLVAAYVVQSGIDLLTAALLAWIGRRHFGPAIGLTAAGLFLFMLEPASFSLRILPSTLQLPLVCLAWLALDAAAAKRTAWRGAAAGAALGLFALAYASALFAAPVAAVWLWWRHGRNRPAVMPAATLLCATAVVIAPATLHNYRATGEFIPISAQAGVTFAQGNSVAADGTYTAVPGVSQDRERQNRDAFRIFEKATGKPPTWNAVNRYFFDRGFDYWRAAPAGALRLLLVKAYWFISGTHYGDIYVPTAERAAGLLKALYLTPVQTVWLMPAALLALAVWIRRREQAPALLLFAIPLGTVLLFWFSPRYRYPAIPVVAVGAAWSIVHLVQWGTAWRSNRARGIAGVAALACGLALGPLNRVIGFDPPESRATYLEFQLGRAAFEIGKLEEARRWYERVLQKEGGGALSAVDRGATLANLGATLVSLGQAAAAVPYLRAAVEQMPDEPQAHNQLGRALATTGQPAEALAQFREAVRLDPDSANFHHDLAVTLAQQGATGDARTEWETALRIDPQHAKAHLMFGMLLAGQGDGAAALTHYRAAQQADTRLAPAYLQAARMLAGRGEFAACLAELRRAREALPQDREVLAELAFQLAALPGLGAAERREGLELARGLAAAAPGNPTALDLLATALQASGQQAEAVRTVRQAIQLAQRAGAAGLAQALQERLRLLEGAASAPAGDSRP